MELVCQIVSEAQAIRRKGREGQGSSSLKAKAKAQAGVPAIAAGPVAGTADPVNEAIATVLDSFPGHVAHKDHPKP